MSRRGKAEHHFAAFGSVIRAGKGVELRESTAHDVLVMRCEKGFYLIDAVEGVSLEKQARDNGELNLHILRVELLGGKVLWERTKKVEVH